MLGELAPRGSLALYPVGNDTLLDVFDYTQLQNNRPGGSTWNKHPIKKIPGMKRILTLVLYQIPHYTHAHRFFVFAFRT